MSHNTIPKGRKGLDAREKGVIISPNGDGAGHAPITIGSGEAELSPLNVLSVLAAN